MVLAGGESIGIDDLRLSSTVSAAPVHLAPVGVAPVRGAAEQPASDPPAPGGAAFEPLHDASARSDGSIVRPHASTVPDVAAWQALTGALRAELAAMHGHPARPIGKWLGYEVVLQAHDLAGGVMARAADRVGLSDTTFVRRLRQAQAETVNILYPASWPALRAALIDVLRTAPRGEALAERVDDLMFELVVDDTPQSSRVATLMGLSVPTVKRRMSDFLVTTP